MTDQPGRESIEDGMSSYSVDADDQLQPEQTLVDQDVDDVLDTGYSPPERPREVDAFGTTATEQSEGETIDMRIQQEVPDPGTAYGAPDNESGLDEDRIGGDDPDSIDADDDFLGDGEVGNERSGRLVAPDEGSHEDTTKGEVGEDVGIDGAAASAEEAAMHTIDDNDAS